MRWSPPRLLLRCGAQPRLRCSSGLKIATATYPDGYAHRPPNSAHISGLLRAARPSRRAQLLARAHRRSHAALHQRGHEPVQGRFSGPRAARLQARHFGAEVRARRRQAQRSRKRRLHQSPPHFFRDAGEFFLWRLLQERRRRVRLGTGHLSAAGRFGIPLDKLYFTVFGGAEITPGENAAASTTKRSSIG